jgi:hypothetical protein
LFVATEALPTLRLGMKRVLLSFCLSGAVVSAPIALDLLNLHRDNAIPIAAISADPSSPLQFLETVALQSEQDEIHSVVVEMPQVISLSYASPETWGSLPMPLQPYEQPATTPVFQLAANVVEKTIPQGKDPPGTDEEQRTAPPAEHKGVITPPPVGDEGIYTKVPNPEAGHEKEVIPPPGSPGGDPNVDPR